MSKRLITTIGRVIRIPDSTASAALYGLLIGGVLVVLMQPLFGRPSVKNISRMQMHTQHVLHPSELTAVLEHKGKQLTLTGEMAQIWLDNWELLGPWEGADTTQYQDCPGLGYEGEYLPFKKGMLVRPKEYEPKCMPHAEFTAQRTKPEPYSL